MEQSKGPVTLQGTGVADLVFRSMEFFEGIGTAYRYVIDVLSDKPDLEAKTYLGQPLSVILEIEEKDPRVFSGIVTEFGIFGTVGQNTLYRLVVQPWLALLQLVSNCRIFQEQRVPDIVLAVFRKHGFSDVELRLSMPHEPRLYTVQYRESDYNFVCRLLEDEGIYFFFEHAPGQHTLVLCDSLSAHEPAPSCPKLPYFPPDQNRRLLMDYVERWQVNSRVESGRYALRDYNFEAAGADKGSKFDNAAEHDNGAYQVYDYPGIYLETGAGDAIAKRRLHELQATRTRAEGRANARGMLVGALLTLEQHPLASQNRQYLVLSMNGSVRMHALESAHEFGDDEDVYVCNFECIDTELPYQPPRRTPKPVVHGAQTAVVRGGKDSEIFTDDYGRVRLEFHWDRESPSDDSSSCWVRVAQAWAGSGFGAVFTPRVGHEVLVDFLEGDPDRPIVTGSVYNSDNKPPYLPLNASQSGIKTRSTLKGTPDNFNEIRFEDKIGEEQFFMQAEKDHTINVKNNRSATIGAADSISVGASRSVSVTDNLSVTVGTGGAAESTLHVTGTHRTDATDTVDVQAPNHVKLTCGKSSITLTDGKIEIVVDGGGKIVIDANVLAESKDTSQVVLDANAFVKSSGKSSLLLDKNACMTSSGQSQALLDGDATLKSEKGACNVEGATKVALMGGKVSQLDLEPAGATLGSPTTKVTGKGLTEITGPMVKIN
jgi:type VI secretion system secreted protein VgrG